MGSCAKIVHLRLTFDPYFLYALKVLIQSAADGIVLGVSVIAGIKATVLSGVPTWGKLCSYAFVPLLQQQRER